MRVRFTLEARDAIRQRRNWWEANRDKAPHLFRDELRVAVSKLRTTPTEAQQYMVDAGRTIWRVLMPKTRTHVYYRSDEGAGEVEVLAIWNAQSGALPDL